MNEIRRIESKLNQARGFLADESAKLERDGSDAAAIINVSSWERHISQLEQERRLLQRERNKEVVEFRLQGIRVDNGSIPLDILGEIATNLHVLFGKAVHKMKYGTEAERGIPEDVLSDVDLRLSGLSYGSSKLSLSGNVSPDLTGDSLFQNALIKMFDALNSEDDESTHEHLQSLGIKAANGLIGLLKALSKNRVSVDMSWDSPSDAKLEWKGRLNAIDRKLESLEAQELSSSNEIIVVASVDMLSSNGRIHLKDTRTDEVYKGSYPANQRDFVSSLTLGDINNFIIMEEIFLNHTTDATKTTYTLIGVQQNYINPL